MKKAKFITGVMTCMLAALAVTGCDLELSDAGTRASTAVTTTAETGTETVLFTTSSTVTPTDPVYVHFTAEYGTFVVTTSDGNYTNKELTSVAWWDAGNGGTTAVTLTSGKSISYTFTATAGADALVEAYDSASSAKYLSTTTQLTAWGDLTPSNAGTQTTGWITTTNTYKATVSYTGTTITVTYYDEGATN